MDKREWMLQAALNVYRAGGETTVEQLSANYDAIIAATPTREDEGWQTNTGEPPYPQGMVEVQLRSGDLMRDDADNLAWDHVGGVGDILEYRHVT